MIFVSNLLLNLTRAYASIGSTPLILIDEYDVPLQSAWTGSLSYFDSKGDEPEKFYHGLVLGLNVSFSDTWNIRSNRESGFGRCDILPGRQI